MFCHNCGSIIRDSATSCRHCGIGVQPVSSSSEAPPEPPAPEPPAPPPEPVRASPPPLAPAPVAERPSLQHCRRCGSGNELSAAFCCRCGTPMRAAAGKTAFQRSLHTEGGLSWVTTIILCSLGFVGVGGLHRFYTGHVVIGVVQLLTGGLCMIWTLIDLILIAIGEYRDAEGRDLVRS